jgi:protein regulator of cytokinesis 1
LDIAGLATKKHSFGAVNAREPQSPMLRQPFSPISSTVSSKSNILEEATTPHNDTFKKTLQINDLSFKTPSKTNNIADEENRRTPKAMPIPMPMTPSTVSVPMQTAMTPAVNPVETPEEIEYSFEERRAGFVLPNTHIKSVIQLNPNHW